jgi:hypothetical protein
MDGKKFTIKIIVLTLVLLNFILVHSYGQFTLKMKYRIPGPEVSKSTDDSVLLISPEFQMTGLVVKIDTSDSFTNTFIIAESDTIYLKTDDHSADTLSCVSSNLVVFKNKLSEFGFYPAAIDNEVEFFLINASPSKKVLRKMRRKKKRCRLFRARND